MIRIFTGFDPREAVGWHVFNQSLIDTAGEPFSVTPLYSSTKTDGTNAFTYARFDVPKLCGFEGWAIFVDGCDMLCLSDIGELWALRDKKYAVQVVKHFYQTKAKIKYIGTELESPNSDYPRKNWSSLMLINCSHPVWNVFLDKSPEQWAKELGGAFVMRMEFMGNDLIGELPSEWNHLVREYDQNPAAKLAHFTLGIPGFDYYAADEYADRWRETKERAQL